MVKQIIRTSRTLANGEQLGGMGPLIDEGQRRPIVRYRFSLAQAHEQSETRSTHGRLTVR